MRLLGGSVVVLLVALVGGWSCGGHVPSATGGAGGSTSVGSHAASVSSTSGGGGGFGGATSGGGSGGGFGGATSGGGSGGAGGSGCTDVMCAGVCTDPFTDPSNCGNCGTVCSFPHAGAACVAGYCRMGACEPGWADCNGHPSDGCEVDVGNDPLNCGACDSWCGAPHETAVCTQGMCTITGPCDPGWIDCDGDPSNGCEANLQNDPMNCGQCGFQCDHPCICISGTCGLGCPKGRAMCNPPTNLHCITCDTDLGTNKDCRFCGDVCALPNATSQCTPNGQPSEFVCALVSCNAGFADCDKDASNGCEVDTTSDPANCGTCGNACAGGQTCTGGVCQ